MYVLNSLQTIQLMAWKPFWVRHELLSETVILGRMALQQSAWHETAHKKSPKNPRNRSIFIFFWFDEPVWVFFATWPAWLSFTSSWSVFPVFLWSPICVAPKTSRAPNPIFVQPVNSAPRQSSEALFVGLNKIKSIDICMIWICYSNARNGLKEICTKKTKER